MSSAASRIEPGADTAAAFEDAWDTFFRAARHARGRAARNEDGSLSAPQYHLISALTAGPLPVGALAEEAGVAPPTATKMLDGLVRAGYVTRSPAPHDRRVVLVSLTEPGREAVAAKRDQVAAVRRRIHAQLSPEERVQAAELLRRLATIVEDL